jgi:hypothetical protein
MDDPADTHEWRRIVESLWDSVAQLRREHDTKRRRKGQPPVTNKEIADEIGVSDRTLGDWLRKRTIVPDLYPFVRLVKYLGGDADEWKEKWRRAREAYDSRPRVSAIRLDPIDPHDQTTGPPRPAAPDGDQGGDLDATPSSGKDRPRSRIIAVIVVISSLAAVMVGVVVAIQSRASRPPSQPTPSVRVWYAKVKDTWSSSQSKDVGIPRYRSPIRNERLLPGLFTGSSVSIVCQYPNGREITDNTYHWTSQVWDKLADGSWIPDRYTDLSGEGGDHPPSGLPVCTGVS